MAATVTQPSQSARRNRYTRSSTTASVTQLLSDSCNSILQRFRRVPSEKPDKLSLTTCGSGNR
jgi:CDC-like kinase